MNARPDPPAAPPGHHYEVETADGWRLAKGKRCRAGVGYRSSACGAPSVAELKRMWGTGWRWWAYCAEHMYGRWVEGGRVVEWRLAEDEVG